MVSFQLFVLECYKVQDTLKKMYDENFDSLDIKLEHTQAAVDFGVPIKSEVGTRLSNTNIEPSTHRVEGSIFVLPWHYI